jgi:ATP-binding cassette subfamily B protein
MANIERMFELLQIEPGVRDVDGAPELTFGRGEIHFENVHFHYHPQRPILNGLDLHVAPGEKVAIVGTSGAGKSTLIKLLFRFYDCTEGRITIDGQDIRAVSQHSLRQAIGIVPQDTVLFNDSILENVRYGRPSASDDEVREAIRLAHLAHFIDQLPEGCQTRVGERGLKLSGGEKQRVAIARTILKRPPILCFDEATSSLDSQSEQAILKAIQDVSRGHTSLVIAHRLSTIVDADRIVVMSKGVVAEQGTHSDLLARGGPYAQLWVAQMRHDGSGSDESGPASR